MRSPTTGPKLRVSYEEPATPPTGASESLSAASGAPQGDSNVNFLLEALRETGEVAAAAVGAQRGRELRLDGAAMSMDEAVAYALASIDAKLLSGVLACRGRPRALADDRTYRPESTSTTRGWQSMPALTPS